MDSTEDVSFWAQLLQLLHPSPVLSQDHPPHTVAQQDSCRLENPASHFFVICCCFHTSSVHFISKLCSFLFSNGTSVVSHP